MNDVTTIKSKISTTPVAFITLHFSAWGNKANHHSAWKKLYSFAKKERKIGPKQLKAMHCGGQQQTESVPGCSSGKTAVKWQRVQHNPQLHGNCKFFFT